MANIVRCLLFPQGQEPRMLALDDVSEVVGGRGHFIWIELQEPDAALLNKLGEELGLHELAVEDALSAHQRPKLEEYGDHVFIAVRTAQPNDDRIRIGETHLFAGANFIVVIQHHDAKPYDRVCDKLRAARNGRPASAPLALYLVLDLVVDEFRPVIEALRQRFEALEMLLLSASLGRKNLERLYAVKRDLTELRNVVEPVQEIVQDLIRLHPEFVSRELRAYYRDVHDHAVRISTTIAQLRDTASDAMQFHIATVTLKQNESVQKLAGWGALLALPTVVFSLYGMNFESMPELAWPWAYPLVLIGTGAGVAWLYRRLRKRRWI
jgi:magnesium transporter